MRPRSTLLALGTACVLAVSALSAVPVAAADETFLIWSRPSGAAAFRG